MSFGLYWLFLCNMISLLDVTLNMMHVVSMCVISVLQLCTNIWLLIEIKRRMNDYSFLKSVQCTLRMLSVPTWLTHVSFILMVFVLHLFHIFDLRLVVVMALCASLSATGTKFFIEMFCLWFRKNRKKVRTWMIGIL